MISEQIHRNNLIQMVASMVAAIIVLWAGALFFVALKQVIHLESLQETFDELEINIHEEAETALLYIANRNPGLMARIQDSVNDQKAALDKLGRHNSAHSCIENLSEAQLHEDVNRLNTGTRNLVSSLNHKHLLLSRFLAELGKSDELMDKNTLPPSLFEDPEKLRAVLRLEVTLAKATRHLGLFMETGTRELLISVDRDLNASQLVLEALGGLATTDGEHRWLSTLNPLIKGKHRMIRQIAKLHTTGNTLLAQQDKQLARLDRLLDDRFQARLHVRSVELEKKIRQQGIILCLAAVILLGVLLNGARILTGIRVRIQNDLGTLLAITTRLSLGKDISPGDIPKNNNEFNLIGSALLEMQEKLKRVSFSKAQVDQMLDEIGPLRFVLHNDDTVSRCSESLVKEMFPTGLPETLTARTLLGGNTGGYLRYRQLVHFKVFRDRLWHLFDGSGQKRIVSLSGLPLDGESLLIYGDRKDWEPDAEDLFNRIPPGLLVVDRDGRILEANPSSLVLLGLPSDYLPGENMDTLFRHPDCNQGLTAAILANHAKDNTRSELICNLSRPEKKRYSRLRVHELSEEGARGFILQLEDITRIRLSEERSRQLAYFDSLTGLPNRARIIEIIEENIQIAGRTREKLAVVFLDLDAFKDVNDVHGHDCGDKMLAAVGTRIKKVLRESDAVGRLGGDEFCLVMNPLEKAVEARAFSGRILSEIRSPLRIKGQEITLGASVGIAIYPNDGNTAVELLKAADTAMYTAKKNQNDTIAYYSAQMTRDTEQRIHLENQLRRATNDRDFLLHYQPQIDMFTGRMVGVEALIRWPANGGGIVSPGEFIPVAESMGLINDIGLWVMGEACRQAMAWNRPDLTVAVNVSAIHFESSQFSGQVAQVLAHTGLPPRNLEIEITESTTRDVAQHIQICNTLSQMGVNIAIDDFGTGYSSLAVLKQLRLHTLKIDQQFVKDLLDNTQADVTIEAILAIARGMNLQTVTEGVETREQMTALKELGCRLAQGYWFSRPVPAGEIPALFNHDFLQSPPTV